MLKLILLNENFHPGFLISAQFLPFPSCPLSQACYHPEISGLCGYKGLPTNLLAGAKLLCFLFPFVDVWAECKSCAAEGTSTRASLAKPVWGASSHQAGWEIMLCVEGLCVQSVSWGELGYVSVLGCISHGGSWLPCYEKWKCRQRVIDNSPRLSS